MNTTYSDYLTIARDTARSIEAIKRQPTVSRATDYYLEKIGQIKTAEEFVSDRRLLTYAMTAFGLGDMTYAKGFVRKLLKDGTDLPEAFANQLTDQRYLDFAKAFDFKRYGAATTAFGAAQTGVVDKYLRQTLEAQAGARNEGVRLALYFERAAPKLENVTEILADRALIQVVRTALSLPDSFSLYDIDKQISFLETRIKVEDFASPAKLRKFVERFSALWDVSRPSQSSSLITALFSASSSGGLTEASLAALTNARARR
ncbi:MAG: DUF1217 domain-containing protein [Rhizobiaceae bacterium]